MNVTIPNSTILQPSLSPVQNMAALCTVNETSRMSRVGEAWVDAQWDNYNKTFDVGNLANKSAEVIWASAFPHEPFIIGKCYETDRFNLTGTFVESLQQICMRLHLRCKIRHADFGTSSNDSLNGVLGDILTGKADVGISAYSINPGRAQYFDLIPSSFSRYYEVVIHENNTFYDNSTPLLLSLVKLIQPSVWVIIVAIFLTFLILLALSEMLQFEIIKSKPKSSFPNGLKKWSLELLGSALATYDIEIKLPETSRSQIFLVGAWLCWTIIIFNFFASQLPSVLVTGRLKQVPFQSVEELARSDYALYGTPYIKSLLESHKKMEYQELGSHLIPISNVSPEDYNRYVVKLLESGKVAVIVSSDTHYQLAELSCGLVIAIPNIASSVITGLIFPKNSSLRSSFVREFTAQNQMGIPQADYDFYIQFRIAPRTRRCVPRLFSSSVESTFSHLSITDVYFIVIIWLCGLGCAFALFGIEVLTFLLKKVKNRNF